MWWDRPEDLVHDGHRLLRSAQRRSDGYVLVPRRSLASGEVIKLALLEGYTPEGHSKFWKAMEERHGRFVSMGSRYSYTEYLGRFGRIRLYEEWGDETWDFGQWAVFFPTNVPVDEFFAPEVAVLLDISRKRNFSINIMDHHAHMVVVVEGRHIHTVKWLFCAHCKIE
jgi:hypothetical protein